MKPGNTPLMTILPAMLLLCAVTAKHPAGIPTATGRPAKNTMYIKNEGKPEIKYVQLEGGCVYAGSPVTELGRNKNEVPRKIYLDGFRISSTEITFAQYDAFCDATGHSKPDDMGWGRGNRPVINVTFRDACDFAEWMGARLPTEAEWEYACRAGNSAPYDNGDCLNSNNANYNGKKPYYGCLKGVYTGKTVETAIYNANKWGMYDMHGNVWEWCMDHYSECPGCETPVKHRMKTSSLRVIRGGGYNSPAWECRAASRKPMDGEKKSPDVGFRIVIPDEKP